MVIIGLTGNIACGKSTVARMLVDLGATLIDADLVVHQVMEPGRPVWRQIVADFGEDILNPDRTINRPKLGSIVFNDPQSLHKLELIIHPDTIRTVYERAAQAKTEIVVIEAVKLVEAGWKRDSLWVVTCSPEMQLQRLMRDRCMSEADARARLSAQPSLSEKLRLADIVIDNSGTREDTLAQVKRGLERVLAGAKS